MYCKNCGTEIVDTAKFCPACGASNTPVITPTVSYQVTTQPKNMATWKTISGVLSFALSLIVLFQSCAAGLVESVSNETTGGSVSGLFVALLLIAAGVVSIATRKSRGGNIAIIIICGIGALIGFAGHGIYEDLIIWSVWHVVQAVVALICYLRWNTNDMPNIS